jgi:exonuclease III
MSIKISTLNLCLGLPNKKTLVEQIIKQENIDVCALQETEINENFDHTMLSFPGFAFESETNSIKSRVRIYIHNGINFNRRCELEGQNSHIVIVDLVGIKELRIFNVYRCFNPQNNMSAKELFVYKLNVIKSALSSNCIVLGDFNFDLSKKGKTSY